MDGRTVAAPEPEEAEGDVGLLNPRVARPYRTNAIVRRIGGRQSNTLRVKMGRVLDAVLTMIDGTGGEE